jgi:hypothetical protein
LRGFKRFVLAAIFTFAACGAQGDEGVRADKIKSAVLKLENIDACAVNIIGDRAVVSLKTKDGVNNDEELEKIRLQVERAAIGADKKISSASINFSEELLISD